MYISCNTDKIAFLFHNNKYHICVDNKAVWTKIYWAGSIQRKRILNQSV